MDRGYQTVHQTVRLCFQSLSATTTMTLAPLRPLDRIHLHAHPLAIAIDACSIDAIPCSIERTPSSELLGSTNDDDHPGECDDESEMHARRMRCERTASALGNVILAVPSNAPIHPSQHATIISNNINNNINSLSHESLVSTPPETPFQEKNKQDEDVADVASAFQTVTVTIKYRIISVNQYSLHYLRRNDIFKKRWPQMYALSMLNSAQWWMPCVDVVTERYTWELEFIVPSVLYLNNDDTNGDDEDDEDVEGRDCIVVCSGELKDQVVFEPDPSMKRLLFEVTTPVPASLLQFAIGPFHVHVIPPVVNNANSSGHAASHTPAYFFSLTPHPQTHLTSHVATSIDILMSHVGLTFPFPALHVVLLPPSLCINNTHGSTGAGLIFLRDPNQPEQWTVPESVSPIRRFISRAVAAQWFGCLVGPKTWADTWLCVGLAGRLGEMVMRKVDGVNASRFELRDNLEKLAALDVDRDPLYPANPTEWTFHEDLANDPFVQLKAPLVVHVLERHLGKNILQKVLGKILFSAISGDLPSGLSTSQFLKTIKKTTTKDIKLVSEQWIYSAGVPYLTWTHSFNRRKMVIDFQVVQKTPSLMKHKQNSSLALIPPITQASETEPQIINYYVGPVTARVHEPSGTYDHVLLFDSMKQTFEVTFHTKYKRGKKRIITPTVEDQRREFNLVAPGEIFDDELANEYMKLHRWLAHIVATPQSYLAMREANENAHTAWITIDPDQDTLLPISFTQTEIMSINQLMKDKDVMAQYHAVKQLEAGPTEMGAIALLKCILNQRIFYRVRMAAVLALGKSFVTHRLQYVGLKYLLMVYKKKYCFLNSSAGKYIPKRNSFASLPEYYLRKAILESLSNVVLPIGGPLDVKPFLIQQMELNDNAHNPYNDTFLVAKMIESVGIAFLMPIQEASNSPQHANQLDDLVTAVSSSPLFSKASSELDRRLFLETVTPSYNHLVGQTILTVLTKWSIYNLIPAHTTLRTLILFSRYGTATLLRLHAIDHLVHLGIGVPKVVSYLWSLIKEDPDLPVRRNTAYAFLKLARRFKVLYDRAKESGSQVEVGSSKPELVGDQVVKTVESVEVEDLSVGDNVNVMVLQKQAVEKLEKTVKGAFERVEFKESLIALVRDDKIVVDSLVQRYLWELYALLFGEEKVEKMKAQTAAEKRKLEESEDEMQAKRVKMTEPTTNSGGIPKISFRVTMSAGSAPPVPERPDIIDRFKDTYDPNLGRNAQTLVEKMKNHPLSAPFLLPVNTSLYPDYAILIKTPMDLSTISKKVADGKYSNMRQVVQDVRLIFKNCYTYNIEGSMIHEQAKKLESFFEHEVLPTLVE